MFFRKGKDETDEFTRIREAVRVDEVIEEGSTAAWPRPPAPVTAPGSPPATGLAARPGPPAVDTTVSQPQTSLPQTAAQNGTVISPETSFEGRLTSESSIHVQGKVKGEIRAKDTVYVAREAKVEAQIHAGTVIVAGEVIGDVSCTDKLEVIPSGRISGEVAADRLIIHEGAFVNSAFKMPDKPTGRSIESKGDGGNAGSSESQKAPAS